MSEAPYPPLSSIPMRERMHVRLTPETVDIIYGELRRRRWQCGRANASRLVNELILQYPLVHDLHTTAYRIAAILG